MRTLPAIAALAAAPVTAQAALQAPCFATPLGVDLGLDDDGVASQVPLGFAFPIPGGGSVTAVDVCANGFVWLADNGDDGCCDADLAEFLTDDPRIAPLWMDLDPDSGGAVWFASFPAQGGLPARAAITWQDVPELGEATGMTVQLQLFADGSFAMLYDARVDVVTHTALVGFTEGTAATANPIDASGIGGGLGTLANPTAHELLPQSCDLAGRSFACWPNGAGGYQLQERSHCTFANVRSYGAGCPKPAAIYETFTTGDPIDLSDTALEFTPAASGGYVVQQAFGFDHGYQSPIVLGDDSVLTVSLPFSFAYPGGATQSLGVGSNGFAWLQGGNADARCCEGDAAAFLSGPASIAFAWFDLDPLSGGACYYDTTPSTATITFVDVPEFGTGNLVTAQLLLRADGSFRMAWQQVGNVAHLGLIGFSGGGIGGMVPSVDLDQGPHVTGGGGTPLQLATPPGALPQLGTTLQLSTLQIPANPSFSLMLLGTTPVVPGAPIGALGVSGCELHLLITSIQPIAYVGDPSSYPLTIPNNPFLVGFRLLAQSAVFAPAANAAGFISSNALELTVGL